MKYNILIGGSAGQGIETSASILEKIFKKSGLEVFTTKDYMSRVRGGHNFIQIRFGDERITSHSQKLDGMIAVNAETAELHKERLNPDGFILGGTDLPEHAQNLKFDLEKIAKEVGNVRVTGSIAVGALLKIFGLDLEIGKKVMEASFKPSLLEVNIEALSRGYELTTTKYHLPTKPDENRFLINGNEGIALGALAAGVKFYSAYPMTPSTSIMNYISSKMQEAKVVVEQAEDEIAGINMAIGASYAGVRAMTGTSGGGFSLKVEALGLAGMLETPLVVANIQRPGPATGFPTRTEQSDLKFIISASHGEFPRMVIAVRDPEDAFYQTVRAFNLADKYQIPVILLGDQYHADTTLTMEAFDFDKVTIERHLADPDQYKDKEYKRYALTESGISDRLIPGRTHGNVVLVDSDEHDESGHITESAEVRVKMVDKRMNKQKLLQEELQEPKLFGKEDCEVCLVGWGSTQGAIEEAVESLNEKGGSYGALVFGDIFPLPIKSISKMAKTAKTIINVEQNATGQLGGLITEFTGIFPHKSLLKYDGRQICASDIIEKLEGGEA